MRGFERVDMYSKDGCVIDGRSISGAMQGPRLCVAPRSLLPSPLPRATYGLCGWLRKHRRNAQLLALESKEQRINNLHIGYVDLLLSHTVRIGRQNMFADEAVRYKVWKYARSIHAAVQT